MKNLLLPAFIALLFLPSCDNDDPEIPNPEELITTLIVSLESQGDAQSVELRFTDLDGDGGDEPVYSVESLAPNTVYNASITLLNESESPAENISDEVQEEDAEHQVFYQTSATDLQIAYNDQDGGGNPLGLQTIWSTGNSESTTVTIILRHEPNKSASGVSDGQIANAGGETDIEVTFNVEVQ